MFYKDLSYSNIPPKDINLNEEDLLGWVLCPRNIMPEEFIVSSLNLCLIESGLYLILGRNFERDSFERI